MITALGASCARDLVDERVFIYNCTRPTLDAPDQRGVQAFASSSCNCMEGQK